MRGPRLRRTVCRTWINPSQGRGVRGSRQGSSAGTRGFHEDEGGDTSIVHYLITDWQWAYGDALRLLGEPRRNRCGLGRTEWSETDPGQGNGTSGSRDSPFGRLRAGSSTGSGQAPGGPRSDSLGEVRGAVACVHSVGPMCSVSRRMCSVSCQMCSVWRAMCSVLGDARPRWFSRSRGRGFVATPGMGEAEQAATGLWAAA